MPSTVHQALIEQTVPSTVHQALIEQTLRAHLRLWLPSHLRRVATENGLEPRGLPEPRSWPVGSEFDLQPHEQLPAVFIIANGKSGPADRSPRGWRATWSCEIAVAVAAQTEEKARERAGMLLAAVETALLWHQTLGGLCEHIAWGAQDLAIGAVSSNSYRAVFGAQFNLVIPVAMAHKPPEEPAAPPPEPYEPPDPVEPFETADITVTPETPTEEPA